MLVYLSLDLGITWISISLKLFNSLKIIWLSYPSKLWKIIGSFLGIFYFELNSLCAGPLYTGLHTCYMTMISYFIFIFNYFSISYPTILRILIIIFIFYSHFQFFVKVISNYLITILLLFKNQFNKFINTIFTFKNNRW